MSRCRSCNEILDRAEELRTSVATGEPLDLCDICFDPIKNEVATYGDSYMDNDYESLEDYDSEEY